MAFRYHPIIGGDLFEAAERFAVDVERRPAARPDDLAWQEMLASLWDEATHLGWPLSLIPEASGGVGASLEDAFALIEGAGRFALPMPMTKALLLAPHMLRPDDLAGLASGEMRPTVVLDAIYPWRDAWAGTAALEAAGNTVSGAILGTELVPGTTHFLIAAGDEVLLVPTAQVEQRIHRRIDGRVAADLHFQGAKVEARHAGQNTEHLVDLAALAACVEIVAGAATVIEDSIGYLSERHQFGVPLSSFQVLRHLVADMYVAYQNAHALISATLRATLSAAPGATWRPIAMAKLRVGEVARFIAETSIQVHGGMGMTEENRPTRIGKRLILADLEWGDRAWQADRLLTAQELAA